MGDIADMILEGILDEQTGEYLGPAVGYPRTREKGCYNTMGRYKGKGPAQSIKNPQALPSDNPIGGVTHFMKINGIAQNDMGSILTEYCTEKYQMGKRQSYTVRCKKISEDFEPFKQWFLNKFIK